MRLSYGKDVLIDAMNLSNACLGAIPSTSLPSTALIFQPTSNNGQVHNHEQKKNLKSLCAGLDRCEAIDFQPARQDPSP